jgi:LPXTG-motif cell wall-anchored protein
MRRLMVLGLTLVWLMSLAGAARALTVTIYTDQEAWEQAVNDLGGTVLTEDFADQHLNPGVSYISSESGHINPKHEYYQDVLQSSSQNEPMTIWSFVPQIIAYGGTWTLGGPGGGGNSLLVSIPDLSCEVGAISNRYNGDFWGFVSDEPFTSVLLKGGTGTRQQNYKLDDMVYSYPVTLSTAADSVSSHVVANPVPPSALLLGTGLLGLGALSWRRRRKK